MCQSNPRHGANDVSDSLRQKCVPVLIKHLDDRFSSFNNSLYENRSWLNPANWRVDVTTEVASMEVLAAHFSTPLAAAGCQSTKIKREWQTLKVLHKSFYRGMKARDLWGQIIQYRRDELPNLHVCLLVEVQYLSFPMILCFHETNKFEI